MHNYLVTVYATYLVAAIALCAGLARSLYRNGAIFLKDVFEDQPEFADAVNHLLVTGFAMFNLGYAFFLLKGGLAADATEAFEVLAQKLGVLLVSLAVVHFVNMGLFHWLNARRRTSSAPLPAPPAVAWPQPQPGPQWQPPQPPAQPQPRSGPSA